MEIYIFKGPQGVLMSPKVWKELIQLVSAGHPCQPFAGQGSQPQRVGTLSGLLLGPPAGLWPSGFGFLSVEP